jgi:hypothetical protein
MALNTANMGLTAWDQQNDLYDGQALEDNWNAVDEHTHIPGKGVRIPTSGIADNAISDIKIVDGVVTGAKLFDTVSDIADNAITGAKVADDTITKLDLGSDIVPSKGAVNSSEALRAIGVGAGQAVAGNDSRLTNARIPIGSAGGLLKGAYPNPTLEDLPSCRIQRTTSQSLQSNKSYFIEWNSPEEWNDGTAIFRSGTGLYINSPGLYYIQGVVSYEQNFYGQRNAMIQVANSVKARSIIKPVFTGAFDALGVATPTSVMVSTTVEILTSGSSTHIGLVAYQNSGDTLQTASGSNYTWMSINKLRDVV